MSNAAKVIKDKLVAFLLEAKAEVEALAKQAAKKQRRSKNFEQDLKRKPTINKVKEIINPIRIKEVHFLKNPTLYALKTLIF